MIILAALMVGCAVAQTTTAQQYFVLDTTTNDVIDQRNANQPMAPSSMTKILTAYIVFNAIEDQTITLNQRFSVPDTAYERGGSRMWLRRGEAATVEDLIKGLIIVSGNDAGITLATGISGSEAQFADLMNETAQALGMRNSHFVNASGWPDENHYSTAADIAILCQRLIEDHPDYYAAWLGDVEFEYNDIPQVNRNHLLTAQISSLPGETILADGIKTGRTDAGGFGIAASAINSQGRRIILIMNGLKTEADRRVESQQLLESAFSRYKHYPLFETGQTIGYAPIWLGQKEYIPLIATRSVLLTLSEQVYRQLTATLVFNAPIEAPVYIDQPVGELRIAGPGIDPIIMPVVAGEAVDRVGRFEQVINGLKFSLLRLSN